MNKIFYIFILVCKLISNDIIEPIRYISNDISQELINERISGSHIKIYLPSIPYTYISKLINGTLFRLSDNEKGWEPMLASGYQKLDDLTYDITLKKNIKFQDGTPFNANSVVENIEAFIRHPFTYTDIHNRLKSIEKISSHKVRFFLKKPYGMFLRDLARINLYSSKYLKKFSWQGDATGDNTKVAGAYGLGPYILTKGYATGRKQTPIVELQANPYYYEKEMPYVEKITIFTELTMKKAFNVAVFKEGELDITPIPFDKKAEVVQSKYTKLVTIPSTNNISIYFNLMKKTSPLKNLEIRCALNQAINQEKLLHFVYKNEGKVAPTTASINFKSVQNATKDMHFYGKEVTNEQKNQMKKILNGLQLHVITQDRFMFLWKGIEYQLEKYGVKLIYLITNSEKDIYKKLLINREQPQNWDILTWGNDDWYGKHPWTVFFSYRTSSNWSAIDKDDYLQTQIQTLFNSEHESFDFNKSVKNIIHRVYKKAYMLFIPSVNGVYAVNKEVDFHPTSIALMPLWKTKITKYHWSIRKIPYPKERYNPMYPQRIK